MEVMEDRTTFAQMFAAAFGVPAGPDLPGEALDDADAVQTANVAQAPPQAPVEPARALTLGEHYREIFKRYCEAVDAWAKSAEEVRNDEKALLASVSGTNWYAIEAPSEVGVSNMKEAAATGIRKRLVFLAMEQFAPPGGKLEISEYDIAKLFPVKSTMPEAYDPAAVWEFLEATYGGEAGKRLAWQQIANAFKNQFFGRHCDKAPEVVVKGGYVVLEVRVWIDDFDKKYGRVRLSYSCADGLRKKCNVLSEIAGWAERDWLARDLEQFPARVDRHNAEIVSRQQFPLGANGEVIVVTYQNKFEFKLRKDFAEQLQVFLGTYGEEEE